MEKRELVLSALANRRFLYQYAWRLFSAPLDVRALEVTVGGFADEAVTVFAGEDGRLADVQRRLCEEVRGVLAGGEDAVGKLDADYTRLFVGPGKLPAPPWESVYRADGDLLFQESTLEVRQAYREAGFKAAGYPREADDHVATELSFMASLADEASAAVEAGDDERAHAFMTAQVKFLQAHLTRWLPQFAERLNTQAPAGTKPFYPLAAYFAAELCERDVQPARDLAAALR
ncbi:molecular chaperone TorD family protein [Adlercreutzia sp. R21]|uniref:TorD/DmsD family molecular chaperone n=1 Tax=Adlercreutzia wanghongyangiae TaxID=3111451 RepID=UPI002DB77D60|nr:molecular chaperone TorD family protein [Adlercreutzia sp. R21]MEC4184418.1 molecular chaperone TorD family protein [Adlercreutzia sp. R21]